MKRWLPLVILLLAPAVSAAPAETGSEPKPIDITKVTPESLKGVDVEATIARAHAAYQAKRYEDAARAFIEALRQKPGDSNALYNLACCYGLLGHAGPATAFLDAAWAAGYRDIGHVRRDPDFDKVRGDEGFRAKVEALAKKAEEAAKLRGKLLPVVSPTAAVVRVIEPATMDGWKRYPVLIGLHGWGSSAESFARLFSGRGIETPFLYVVPQAPYAFGGGGKPGFSWTTMAEGADRATGIASHLLTERYVLEVLETVKKHYNVDARNVFLMGFSQGAGQAFSIGLKHPELFRGVIPIGGWCDDAEHPATRVRKAKEHGLFLVCHSQDDRVVEFEACDKAKAFLTASDIPHAVLRYPGGHRIPKELAAAIATWIEKPEPRAPELPAPPDKSGVK